MNENFDQNENKELKEENYTQVDIFTYQNQNNGQRSINDQNQNKEEDLNNVQNPNYGQQPIQQPEYGQMPSQNYEQSRNQGYGRNAVSSEAVVSEVIDEDSTGLKERRKIVKIVATAVAAVLAGQIFLGILVLTGFSLVNPGFIQRLGNTFFGEESKGQLSLPMQTGGGTVRNIVIEKTDSPIVAIAEKVGPCVVGIRVTARTANAWPFGGSENTPEGSGIIMRKDGYIMTNNHVVEEAMVQRSNKITAGSKIEVILPSAKDKPFLATCIGRDERTDLAVLKIEANDLPEIEMGNSDQIKVGETVIAIGNPGGLEYMGSVTAGIVSGLNRTIPVEDGKELKLVQTDAAINPGNSGGALVNSRGQLIGINTAKIGGQGFEGLGFAIPVNKVMEVTGSLIEFKYVKGRPLFGIVADPRYTQEMADDYKMPVGVLVSEVTPFTGAYEAGIRPKDIITKFGGTPIKNVNELNDLKSKFKPGDIIDVEIYRTNAATIVKVKLTEDKR